MPVVYLHYKRVRGLDEIAGRLATQLTVIVAEALDVPENPEARLTAGDIEVKVGVSGPKDVNGKDLEITVIAHDYPERTDNVDVRRDSILHGVRKFLADYDRNVTGWVWIQPQQKSSFGKI